MVLCILTFFRLSTGSTLQALPLGASGASWLSQKLAEGGSKQRGLTGNPKFSVDTYLELDTTICKWLAIYWMMNQILTWKIVGNNHFHPLKSGCWDSLTIFFIIWQWVFLWHSISDALYTAK